VRGMAWRHCQISRENAIKLYITSRLKSDEDCGNTTETAVIPRGWGKFHGNTVGMGPYSAVLPREYKVL